MRRLVISFYSASAILFASAVALWINNADLAKKNIANIELTEKILQTQRENLALRKMHDQKLASYRLKISELQQPSNNHTLQPIP